MITGFEEITKELTDYEYKYVVPAVEKGLKTKIGKENAVSNAYIVDKLKKTGIETRTPRIRKIIHFLRITGKIKRLVSSSKGYYIASTKDEVMEYCKSLDQRINSISSIKNALESQVSHEE